MRKTLIALFAAPFIVVILAIAGALVALNWPTLIVNDTTLKIAVQYLAPFGIKAEWKEAETSHVSHGAFDETIAMEFTDLCIGVRPSVKKACFAKASGAVRYRFPGLIPRLVSLGPISLDEGKITVGSSEEGGGDFWKSFTLDKLRLPSLLMKKQIFPIEISIDSLEFDGKEPGPKISGKAKLTPDDSGKIESLEASARIAMPAGKTVELEAKATSDSHFRSGDWKLDAEVRAGLGSSRSMNIEAKLETQDGKEIDLSVEVAYSSGTLRGEFKLAGLLRDDLFRSSLAGTFSGISEVVPSASLADCAIELKRTSRRKNRGDLSLTCPIDIKLKEFKIPDGIDPIYRQPENVVLDISATGKTFFFPDLEEMIDADITARVRPLSSRLVRTTGQLQIGLKGVPAKPLKTWKVNSDIDLDFTIDSFARLVKVLEASPWPVPAPFYVLDGQVQFSLEGQASSMTGRAIFPAKLRTKLSSPRQRLDIESTGKTVIGLSRGEIGRIELDLNANFKDVQIELPPFSLAAIPKFTPDKRIHLETKAAEEKSAEESELDYDLKMKTPSKKPIRLLSNITPTFIPISINVDLKKKDMSGTIAIRDFPIQFFKRTATLNSFKMELAKPKDKSKISGSITVPYDNLRIIVSVAGTLGEPSWALSSKPPMSRGDILSTLIYGEPLDAVGADGADSVSSMNAAMADRRISLTTFLLLATTPIQSLGYNSDTGVFSARIKLAKKTSIIASSSSEEKTVGVRQRLGKGFSIVTGWEKWDDSSSSSGAAAAYIEWGKRW